MSKTKVCKKCGSIMDSSAKACPSCGAPAKKKTGIIIGVVVAMLIIGAATSSGSDGKSDSSGRSSASTISTSSAESTASSVESTASSTAVNSTEESKAEDNSAESEAVESEEEEQSNVYKVGDVLDTGKLKITFQSVEDYETDNIFLEPEEGNKLIRAYFVIENIGKTDTLVSFLDFDCYADDVAVSDNWAGGEKQLSTTTLSSGRKTEGYLYYEVPVNAEKIELEYETSYWTQKKAIFVVK